MSTLDASVNLLNLLGDVTRVRLLALLSQEELSVAEVTDVLGLAQSRVSTHLGRLKDAGVLRDRKAGASTFYRLNEADMPDDAGKLWSLVRSQTDDALLKADHKRCAQVLKARRSVGKWPE